MGILISENFGDLLDARVRKIYSQELASSVNESMVPMIFGMESSTRAYEIVSGVGGMSTIPTFDGSITYDSIGQLYDKTFTFPEYAGGIKVEKKLYDDDMFSIMDRRPWQLAHSTADTREDIGADIFNGAFVGTDGPDSLPLCSASHPYSPDDATVQSNAGSTAISAAAIEATRRIGRNSIYTDRGRLFAVNYDMILCTVNKEEVAWEVINSKGKVDTANNNRNFHEGRYKLAVWDKLTDSDNWFMLDSKLCKMFLLWWDRVKPGIKQDTDTDTLIAKWYEYFRCSAGWADWRQVYGHNVT